MLSLVDASIQTLSTFPPRCCKQPIPTDTFERYMSRDQRSKFEERQAEHDTPKRVYCANPRCSRFLGARDKRVPVRFYTCTSPICSRGSSNGGGIPRALEARGARARCFWVGGTKEWTARRRPTPRPMVIPSRRA